MHVAGGLYRELCEVPTWDAELGSGGRAAAAVSALSPGTTLHTYSVERTASGIMALESLGVVVRAYQSETGVAFAYFHPLSRPHIEPPIASIPQHAPISVEGETVLRFGFLEGDAVVSAAFAVYDPQTWRNPAPFAANGSRAENLAIVLNELELRAAGESDDLAVAARRVMDTQRASVVVAKGGAHGATVFESSGGISFVPSYRSTQVFKIGTGDVFSAIFAHHWAEAHRSPSDAADLASRSVSAYCSTRKLPLALDAIDALEPVSSSPPGTILLEGAVDTIGRRYAMEEARFRLVELGAIVVSPVLSRADSNIETRDVAALLIIADGMSAAVSDHVLEPRYTGIPKVVLAEAASDCSIVMPTGPDLTVTADFASALYFTVWAARAGNQQSR